MRIFPVAQYNFFSYPEPYGSITILKTEGSSAVLLPEQMAAHEVGVNP